MGEGEFVLALPRCHGRPGDEDDGVGSGELVCTGDLLGVVDQVAGRREVAALRRDGGVGGERAGVPERLVGLCAQPAAFFSGRHRG
jgi:hypothetical protein